MKRLSIAFVLAAAAAFAAPIDLGQTKSKAEFLAVGTPSAIKIRGKAEEGKALDGKLLVENGELTGTGKIALDQFDTGIDMRNRHMKEKYLETGKYPETTLTLKPIKLGADSAKPDYQYEGPFVGTLKLHGVEKDVQGTTKLAKKADKWNGAFQFEFELQDYGIEVPKYLGITVSKKVSVDVGFEQ